MKARFSVESAAARVVSAGVRPLPRARALALGRALGRRWGRLDPRHLAIAADNLGHAFPEWDDTRRRATALAVYEHFGQVLLDILWMAPRSREEILRHVVVEGGEHVEAARARGRGTIFLTAHIGNWEMHGLAHSFLFGPIGVIARPLDNPALDARLCAFRARAGNTVIYKRRALGQVMRLLKENGGVAILIDQNVQEGDGVFVDFFGRKAATTTVAAALALKTGCAIVPSYAGLEPDGRYRLVYERPLVIAPSGRHGDDLVDVTQQLTSTIEAWVRRTPQQWLWLHRRWKTQPKGGAP